jgi:dipeptidyl aminopeptidase/acylaminoacyl peptidase
MHRARVRFAVSLAAVAAVSLTACGSLSSIGGPSPGSRPDPKRAILVSVPADAVYLIDPDSGRMAIVAQGLTDFQSGYGSWSPSHAHIAYGSAGVVIANAMSSGDRSLVHGQEIGMPTWSNNGKQIAYANGSDIFVTFVAKAHPTRLALPETLAPFSLDWGPKNTIAFQGLQLSCTSGDCLSTDHNDIYVIQANGSGLHQLTSYGTASNPKWSPDGKHILFVRSVRHKGHTLSELWTIRSGGGGAVPLLTWPDIVAADWSSDGSRLAVVRLTAGAVSTLSVWVGNANGSGMHEVVDGIQGSDASVDW